MVALKQLSYLGVGGRGGGCEAAVISRGLGTWSLGL